MKGTNELRLNTATVIEAMQLWVNRAFMPNHSPEVTGVHWDSSIGTMKVTVREREQRDADE